MQKMKKLLSCFTALSLCLFCSLASGAGVPLGPGDVVKISVYGNADLLTETKVSEAGSVTFPLVGDVQVSGLSTTQAEKKIAGLLEKGGFIAKPQVNILVTLLQSLQVSVLGQVNHPGRFPIDVTRSLADVLALAGGISPDGGDKAILMRNQDGKTTKTVVDLVDMAYSGDLGKNIELQSNDIIFVDRAPRFYIYGEVQRPGVYRLERDMTVLQALSVGGGLTPRGTERGVRIKRRDASGKQEILEAKHDDLVKSDDVVYIQESLF